MRLNTDEMASEVYTQWWNRVRLNVHITKRWRRLGLDVDMSMMLG